MLRDQGWAQGPFAKNYFLQDVTHSLTRCRELSMSEVRYDANPSMVRMHPFATLVSLLLLLGGILLAVMGKQILPAAFLEQAPQLDTRVIQIAGIVLFALAFLRLLTWWISTRLDHLKVTDEELLWTHGFLNKEFTEVSLGSVRTVRVSQSLLQRMMNAGDVTIYTTGDIPELVVRGLPEPNRIRELIKARAPAPGEA
jgi:uncharacterized membrane protein YdbT with pleckstrin-like domain